MRVPSWLVSLADPARVAQMGVAYVVARLNVGDDGATARRWLFVAAFALAGAAVAMEVLRYRERWPRGGSTHDERRRMWEAHQRARRAT